MSIQGGAPQAECSQGRQSRLQHLLSLSRNPQSGGDITCMYRLAFSAVTAPACAPSASMAGMKHDRWSILCFTTPTLHSSQRVILLLSTFSWMPLCLSS